MKIHIYISVLLFIHLSFMSCDKPPMIDVPEEEPDTTKQFLEVLWHAPIDSTRNIVTSDYIHYYKDYVITSGYIRDDGRFFLFDKNTGEKLHTIHFEGNVTQDVNESILYENILIAYTSDGLVAFNLDNLEMVWEIDFEPLEWYYDNYMEIINNHLILKVDEKKREGKKYIKNICLEVNPLNGDYTQLFSNYGSGEYSPTFSLPGFYNDNNNQLLIYVLKKSLLTGPENNFQDVICKDINNDSLKWILKDQTKPASSNSQQILIYKEISVISGDWSIYGYDVNTGERKWRYEFERYKPFASWYPTMHLLKDNRLYINSGGDGVGCIDVSTGQLLWFNEDAGANCAPKMLYVDDMLIYGSFGNGTITILDAYTGEMLYHLPPLVSQNFSNCVTYNEEEDIFYTMSFKEVIAFKLNRE